MRKIVYPLLVTKVIAPEAPASNGQEPEPKPLRVGDILANLFQPTREEGGVTLEVMENWVPLARRLRKAESEILLEDADYTLLTGRLGVTKWLFSNEDIIAIGKAVREAEVIEVEEVPEEAEGPPDDEETPEPASALTDGLEHAE